VKLNREAILMENCSAACSCEVAAQVLSSSSDCEAVDWLIDLYWDALAQAGTSGTGAFATNLFPAGMSSGRGPIGGFAFGLDNCLFFLVKLGL
jgi:hypothetical protein